MKYLLIPTVALLAACTDPLIKDSDVIARASAPAYGYSESGHVIPSSCQRVGGNISRRAPACKRDLVLARQVSNPRDLVSPVTPGPGAAGPLGRAADRYLYGQDASGRIMYPEDPYWRQQSGSSGGAGQSRSIEVE
ncbi:hypothetical protein JJJ17_00175 [Paracoccus caeni]|uniref:Lipoprotein n=1 Tax=Paracoccus caeni TaxID=657651 RepID=A0A934SBK0_9RHOB|nr:hypothetical protein [Paracoccus caeni]MBK4214330.1 hypothetical protein [Paracoccus caeni]